MTITIAARRILFTGILLPCALPLNAANCSAWSAPVNLGTGPNSINSPFPDQGPYVSKDGLSLYFASLRPLAEGGFGANDLYVSTREHKNDAWRPGVNLGGVINTPLTESTPALSRDEKLLFFATNGRGGTTGFDIWVSARKDRRDPHGWQAPIRLEGGINSAGADLGPAPFYDRRTGKLIMYFYSIREGGQGGRDLYQSTLEENGEFGPAVNIEELNTPFEDEQPAIRRDGLEMFFASNRAGSSDIYVSTRASTSDTWSRPVNLGAPINTPGTEGRPALSRDGKSLYFFSDGHGGAGATDLFVSTRKKLDCDDDDDDDDADND